jgi:hypothetical protein
MSNLLINRAQSASSRTVRRTSPSNQASHIQQRPTTSGGARRSLPNNQTPRSKQRPATSVGIQRSHTDRRNPEAALPFEISLPPEKTSDILRRKSLRTGGGRDSQTPPRKLEIHEIHELLESLTHDEPQICKVTCLSLYKKLYETVDLRATPLDWKLLYVLQKQESRIIQKNAVDEIRFQSLMNVLVPRYVPGMEKTETPTVKHPMMSIHPSADDSMEY